MKLKDEQIAGLAPDWATHYRFNSFEVMYESTKKWVAIGLNHPYIKRGPYSQNSKLTKCKPIQRKKFDISEHEFSDDKLSLLIDDADLISINDNCSGSCFDLHKDDAIAIAKHFKLTAEDLK